MPRDLTDITGLEVLVETLSSRDPRQVIHSLGILDYFGKGQVSSTIALASRERRGAPQKALQLMQEVPNGRMPFR